MGISRAGRMVGRIGYQMGGVLFLVCLGLVVSDIFYRAAIYFWGDTLQKEAD